MVRLLFSIPGFIHSSQILVREIRSSVEISNNTYRYEGLKNFLVNRDYPADSVHIPLSVAIATSSEELKWFPELMTVTSQKQYKFYSYLILNELQYYWRLSDLFKNGFPNLGQIKMFVIDKTAEEFYANYYTEFLKNGWQNIYEDNSVIVMGSIPLSVYIAPKTEILIMKKGVLKRGGWDSVHETFSPAINLRDAKNIVLRFDLVHPIENQTNLRVVLNAYGDVMNQNTWHYVISTEEIKRGKNEITIPIERFVYQSGYINWKYVSTVVFGGIIQEDIVMENISVSVE